MDDESEPPRICPIAEIAISEAGLDYASADERAMMVAYVERVKSRAAWEVLEACIALPYAYELIGLACVRLSTGEPMPDDWLLIEQRLRDAIKDAILA